MRVHIWGDRPRWSLGNLLAEGFKDLGHTVVLYPYREIKPADWKDIKDCEICVIIKGTPSPNIIKSKVVKRSSNIKVALWFPDDPHQHSTAEIYGDVFDMIFTGHLPSVKDYERAGIRSHWLPFACDKKLHYKVDTEKKSQVVFVGNENGSRKEYFDIVRRHFKFRSTRAFGENFAGAVCSADLAFNKSNSGETNMRLFEYMGCGIPVLTDNTSGIKELFDIGKDVLVYKDKDDLGQVLSRLDLSFLYMVGQAGQKKVYANHTYKHRAQEIITYLGLA